MLGISSIRDCCHTWKPTIKLELPKGDNVQACVCISVWAALKIIIGVNPGKHLEVPLKGVLEASWNNHLCSKVS